MIEMDSTPFHQCFKARLLFFALALGLMVAVGVVVSSAQSGREPSRDQLEQLRAQILEHQHRAERLAHDEESHVGRIQALEQEAADTQLLLRGLADRQHTLQSEVDVLSREVAERDTEMDQHRERLAAQLRHMYIHGEQSQMELLRTSSDLKELGRRARLLTRLARAERSFLQSVRIEQLEIAEQRSLLNERLAEVHRNRSEAEARNQRLMNLYQEREEALESVRGERSRWEASARELQQSVRELEDLLARLEAADQQRGGAPSTEFISRQGSLPWPVQGKVTRGFGRSVHPRFQTVVINKGINIEAAAGTPIYSVAPGSVDYVNWLPGYGKCIILNHGDGWYSLYAHASEIFPGVGARVGGGQVIAEVGDTGSLDGSQLYFEIRQGKEPVDPARWLDSSRGR